MEPSRL